jgi:hypothetical protein
MNFILFELAGDMLMAMYVAAERIKDYDGGDPTADTGWASDELLEAWQKLHAAIAKAEAAGIVARSPATTTEGD